MNMKLALLAIAAFLLVHPCTANGQANPATVRTTTYPSPSGRGPGWGFSIAMRPGPGNSYTYSFVASVTSGSAAERAGLMVGDTIIAVDGRDVRLGPLFPVRVAGTRYVILVRRGTEELELTYIYPEAEQSPRREGPDAPDR
jgi:C-terminal processing protease CtpA/Prc